MHWPVGIRQHVFGRYRQNIGNRTLARTAASGNWPDLVAPTLHPFAPSFLPKRWLGSYDFALIPGCPPGLR